MTDKKHIIVCTDLSATEYEENSLALCNECFNNLNLQHFLNLAQDLVSKPILQFVEIRDNARDRRTFISISEWNDATPYVVRKFYAFQSQKPAMNIGGGDYCYSRESAYKLFNEEIQNKFYLQ